MKTLIQTNEFMINDFVYAIVDGQKRIVKVRGIELGKIKYQEGAKIYDCHRFEPIPLTAEILEKNEFKYKDCNDEYSTDEIYYEYNYDLAIHINKDDYFELRCIDMPNIKIQYVHELQRALRLCGIELDFKVIEE